MIFTLKSGKPAPQELETLARQPKALTENGMQPEEVKSEADDNYVYNMTNLGTPSTQNLGKMHVHANKQNNFSPMMAED